MRKITIIIFITILSYNISTLNAGNHEVVHPTEGHSIGWKNAHSIPFWTDLGRLGLLSNVQAKALVDAMMSVWESVESANLGFDYQGDLAEEVTVENFSDYLAMTSCGDSDRDDIPKNVVPIVFDSDGSILENMTGLGSSGEIGGISTLRCFVGSGADPQSIHQGMVIINGEFIDGLGPKDGSVEDLSINGIAGVILHELGHLSGLDHTALNEEIFNNIHANTLPVEYSKYLPIMLPTVLRDSKSFTTLHPDDVAAISSLYPKDNYLSESGIISGSIKDKNGDAVQKVNAIARNMDDPLCEAFSAVTGRKCLPILDTTGTPNFNGKICGSETMKGNYVIEGVEPGTYTVEVEELEEGWIRRGMWPNELDVELPGDAEFYNIEDNASESLYKYSQVRVLSGESVAGIDIVLNSDSSNDTQLKRIPISYFEEGLGTRCYEDAIDYEMWLSSLDSGLNIGGNADSGDVSALTSSGCTLNPDAKSGFVSIFVLMFFGLIFILRGLA